MERVRTGIRGLDILLDGGLIKGRPYLITGDPGSGKSILGMQFLHQGVIEHEKGLFVSFEESCNEIIENMRCFGWDLRNIHIMTILPNLENGNWYLPAVIRKSAPGQVFIMQTFIEDLKEKIKVFNIKRIVIDSLTALSTQYNSTGELRRNLLWLLSMLADINCTTLLINEEYYNSPSVEDFIARGVISLTRKKEKNLLMIKKMRGQDFVRGEHYFRISTTGIRVYPNIKIINEHSVSTDRIKTGITGLDGMTRGGFLKGDVTLVIGSPGTGKTMMGMRYLIKNVNEMERGLYISLKENSSELGKKTPDMCKPFKTLLDNGAIKVLSPQFDSGSIEEHLYDIQYHFKDYKHVVVDTISSYRDYLPPHEYRDFLKKLISILKNNNITAILLSGTNEIFDFTRIDEVAGFLADNVILLRYFELDSSVRKSINIIKMRGCGHDTEVREYRITNDGIHIMMPIDIVHDMTPDNMEKNKYKALADVFGYEGAVEDIHLPIGEGGDNDAHS